MIKNSQTVLITGGSGLVGKRLTELLMEMGYTVSHLVRSKKRGGFIKQFQWNLKEKTIDLNALLEADYIVHLAGAGIADKAWSASRKKEIIDSRVKSAELMYSNLKQTAHKVKAFISASAIGIYSDAGDDMITEDAQKADDFLGFTCQLWETSADLMSSLGIRTTKIRTGLVLSKDGGVLPFMSLPVKFFLGSALGSGEQFISWIHLDDLCAIYIKAIEDKSIEGPYNAVAPNPVRNKKFIETIAGILKRPLLLPALPAFFLKLFLGERAAIVLKTSKISSHKIIEKGFEFKYPFIQDALTREL